MPALSGGQGGPAAIERRQQNRQIGIAGCILGQAAEPVGLRMPEAADTGPCGREGTQELPQYITCIMLCRLKSGAAAKSAVGLQKNETGASVRFVHRPDNSSIYQGEHHGPQDTRAIYREPARRSRHLLGWRTYRRHHEAPALSGANRDDRERLRIRLARIRQIAAIS